MDSQFIQLQMADLEQMYIAVILNGALQINQLSSKLVRDLLQQAPENKPPKNRIDLVRAITREILRLGFQIVREFFGRKIDPSSLEGWPTEGLLNYLSSPVSASS